MVSGYQLGKDGGSWATSHSYGRNWRPNMAGMEGMKPAVRPASSLHLEYLLQGCAVLTASGWRKEKRRVTLGQSAVQPIDPMVAEDSSGEIVKGPISVKRGMGRFALSGERIAKDGFGNFARERAWMDVWTPVCRLRRVLTS